MAYSGQPVPDSGLGSQVKVHKISNVFRFFRKRKGAEPRWVVVEWRDVLFQVMNPARSCQSLRIETGRTGNANKSPLSLAL